MEAEFEASHLLLGIIKLSHFAYCLPELKRTEAIFKKGLPIRVSGESPGGLDSEELKMKRGESVETYAKEVVERVEKSVMEVKTQAEHLSDLGMKARERLIPPACYECFVSPAIGTNEGKLAVTATVEPSTILFTLPISLAYPNWLVPCLKEHTYKSIDVRLGILPKHWLCVCCLRKVGGVVPIWCSHCGLPLCDPCGHEDGNHGKIDEICKAASFVKDLCRRFLDLGSIYMDVAISRFIIKDRAPDFSFESPRLEDEPRVLNILKALHNGGVVSQFSPLTLPISFYVANGDVSVVIRSYAILMAFGNAFYPRDDVGIFSPIFSKVTPSCIPNIEIYPNDDNRTFQARATTAISPGELLKIDYVQHPFLPTAYRQLLLESRWGSKCQCERCTDPTESGTYVGSITCRKCEAGYLIPDFERVKPVTKPVANYNGIYCFCVNPNSPTNPCTNMCTHEAIKRRDVLVGQMIENIWTNKKWSPLEKCRRAESLKGILTANSGYHKNYFLLQALSGFSTSPSAQFVRRKPKIPNVDEFLSMSEPGTMFNWNIHVKARLAQVDEYIAMTNKLTPKAARHHAYTQLYRAELENSMSLALVNEGKKTELEWIEDFVTSTARQFLKAWERMLWTGSYIDISVGKKIGSCLLAFQNKFDSTYIESLARADFGREKVPTGPYVRKARTKPNLLLEAMLKSNEETTTPDQLSNSSLSSHTESSGENEPREGEGSSDQHFKEDDPEEEVGIGDSPSVRIESDPASSSCNPIHPDQ